MARQDRTSGTGAAPQRGWALRGLARALLTPGFWFCLPLLALPVYFGQDRIGPSLRSLTMDWQGAIRVEAELTGVETLDAANRPTCRYLYRFRTPEGDEMTGSDRRAGDAFECRRAQPRFAVQYPPGAPQDSRIDHLSLDGWLRFLGLLGSIVVLALACAGVLWWREARLCRIRDHGIAAQGRVTGELTVRGRGGIVMYLQWEDAEGRPGRSLHPLGPAPRPQRGDTIALLIDPATGRTYWRDEL